MNAAQGTHEGADSSSPKHIGSGEVGIKINKVLFDKVVNKVRDEMLGYIRDVEFYQLNEMHRIWNYSLFVVLFVFPGLYHGRYIDDIDLENSDRRGKFNTTQVNIRTQWVSYLQSIQSADDARIDAIRSLFLFSLGNRFLEGCKNDLEILRRPFVLAFWRDFVWSCAGKNSYFTFCPGIKAMYSFMLDNPGLPPIPDFFADMTKEKEGQNFHSEVISVGIDSMLKIFQKIKNLGEQTLDAFHGINPATGLPITTMFQDFLDNIREKSVSVETERLSKNEKWLALKLYYLDVLVDLQFLYNQGRIGTSLVEVFNKYQEPKRILETVWKCWRRKNKMSSQNRKNEDMGLREIAIGFYGKIEDENSQRDEVLKDLPLTMEVKDGFSDDVARNALKILLQKLSMHGAHLYMTFTNGKCVSHAVVPHTYSSDARRFTREDSFVEVPLNAVKVPWKRDESHG